MTRSFARYALTALILAGAGTTQALETRPYLALETAAKAAEACHELARSEGWRMAVAVLDASGRTMHFSRMDDTFSKASDFAMLKAETSSRTPFSTLELRRITLVDSDPDHGIERVPGIVVFEGGLPIRTSDGVQIGGIGVSGSNGANDGRCAQAALDTIAMDLAKE